MKLLVAVTRERRYGPSRLAIRVSVIYLNFTNLSAHVNCGRGSVLL